MKELKKGWLLALSVFALGFISNMIVTHIRGVKDDVKEAHLEITRGCIMYTDEKIKGIKEIDTANMNMIIGLINEIKESIRQQDIKNDQKFELYNQRIIDALKIKSP